MFPEPRVQGRSEETGNSRQVQQKLRRWTVWRGWPPGGCKTNAQEISPGRGGAKYLSGFSLINSHPSSSSCLCLPLIKQSESRVDRSERAQHPLFPGDRKEDRPGGLRNSASARRAGEAKVTMDQREPRLCSTDCSGCFAQCQREMALPAGAS